MTPSAMHQDELRLIVEHCENHLDMARVRFASRYRYSKNYLATIQFDRNMDEEPITRWRCTCADEAAAVDCCVHVTALIWHVGVCCGESETSANPLLLTIFSISC